MPHTFWDTNDTIAARATAAGNGLRGAIRISGPNALEVAEAVTNAGDRSQLRTTQHARVVETQLHLPAFPTPPSAQLLVWPNQRSYTRQPSVEIHTVGAAPVLDAILNQLVEAGARLARPGEFTLRAFLAGRLDLTQAEAVLGVIDAEDDERLKTALEQLAGGLATPLHQMREQLLDLLAHLEAGLDFVDEDIEFISQSSLESQLSDILQLLDATRKRLEQRGDRAGLPRVVLVGQPNAGKSRLFNALLGDDAAIVSPISGATRDYLSARWPVSSTMVCELLDTAGEDDEAVGPDETAQRHTHEQRRQATLQLLCVDGTAPSPPSKNREQDALLRIATKSDAGGFQRPDNVDIAVSAVSGSGLADLRELVANRLAGLVDSIEQATAARCGESLQQAGRAIEHAMAASREQLGEELVAAELRLALDELGRVVGVVYNDDVLDRVFSRFCIGK